MSRRVSLKAVALTIAAIMGLAGCQSTPESAASVVVSQDTGKFVLPSYETVTLDNGLTLMLMPQREVPLINVQAVVKAGSIDDSIAGTAELTAQAALLGAGGKSKQQLEQQVDALGASINADAGEDGSYFTADFMAKDADVMLGVLADVLLRPNYDAAEYDKLKQRTIAQLSQAKESPKSVIARYFAKQLFGDNPYGNAADSSSVANIDVDQLKAFHLQNYQPNNTAIAVVGDFDVAQMKQKLTQLFGQWQGDALGASAAPMKPVFAPAKNRVLLVDKSDAIETTFLIGGLGVKRSNPDLVELNVVNTILGGRFTSWLNDELRVNSGLTYGARSGFISYKEAGLFQISTFTKVSTTEQAVDLALKTYHRLWEQGIDAATLASAKAYVKGQFPPKYETSGDLAGLLSDMYLYGFDASYINDFQKRVDGLTVADTQRLINQYFPKDKLQFVLIGNAAEIAPIAAKYGEVTKVDIKDIGFDAK
ncbi:insulinase family protein [Shewanella sp. C32]|uniref:Insulinase family protein n=1 Tax=Shewanella electrica TaxID=515560 RepID=A0ABT2FN49_9GAMM|nr:pitrilysin family protein [Shewanella electrica]MCH1926275.1 insulinase family protein [Shewanella electrica]MCS4557758.1 insulinase family protein [Shewanella electrica]